MTSFFSRCRKSRYPTPKYSIMEGSKSRKENFDRLTKLCKLYQQHHFRSDELDRIEAQNQSREAENEELELRLFRLEESAKRDKAEIAMLKAEGEVSRLVEDGLRVSLNQSELEAASLRTGLEKLQIMIDRANAQGNSSRDEVDDLLGRIDQLEELNRDHSSDLEGTCVTLLVLRIQLTQLQCWYPLPGVAA